MFFRLISLSVIVGLLVVVYASMDTSTKPTLLPSKPETQKETHKEPASQKELHIANDECRSYIAMSTGKICLPQDVSNADKKEHGINPNSAPLVAPGDFSAPNYSSDLEVVPPVSQQEGNSKATPKTKIADVESSSVYINPFQ